MTDGPHLQHRIAQQIKQYLPDLSRRRFENLTWLMTGIHLSRHVHLSKIAAWRSGRARLPSKVRQLRRFLASETFDPWPLYRPLARLLLETASRHGPIHLLIDRLELSGPRILLMVALAYRCRALPLMWTVIKNRGHSLSADQVQLLQRLDKIIPGGGQVVLLGDGEFRGVPLLVWLVSVGWDFILRAHLDLPVYLSGGRRRQIHELAFTQNGQPQACRWVTIPSTWLATAMRGDGPMSLVTPERMEASRAATADACGSKNSLPTWKAGAFSCNRAASTNRNASRACCCRFAGSTCG